MSYQKLRKKHTKSSARWLQRQMSDPYASKAQADGYLSRAAYKLLEISDKFGLLKKANIVIDLGAAPGSWSQVILQKGSARQIIAVDLLEVSISDKIDFLQGDFRSIEAKNKLTELMQGRGADLVLSDMAANTTGHSTTDHIRTIDLCEHALKFAVENLNKGGNFVVKIFQGGLEKDLAEIAKKNFNKIKYFKPSSSRKESKEIYLVALDKN